MEIDQRMHMSTYKTLGYALGREREKEYFKHKRSEQIRPHIKY